MFNSWNCPSMARSPQKKLVSILLVIGFMLALIFNVTTYDTGLSENTIYDTKSLSEASDLVLRNFDAENYNQYDQSTICSIIVQGTWDEWYDQIEEFSTSVKALNDDTYLFTFDKATDAYVAANRAFNSEGTKYCYEAIFDVTSSDVLNENWENETVSDIAIEELQEVKEIIEAEENGKVNIERMKPVTVAVLDTGYSGDSEKVLKGFSLIDDGYDIYDGNGHGTRLINIIDKMTFDNVSILPIKVANSDGFATVLSVSSGIKIAIEQNVDIINISMNANAPEGAFLIEDAIKEAKDAGIEVVVSAGNKGVDVADITPSNVKEAIVISAVALDDKFESYSNYGDTIDYATYGNYDGIGGTSISAARFSAMLAYELGIRETESALKEVAYNPNGVEWDKYFGHGIINPADVYDAEFAANIFKDIKAVTETTWEGKTACDIGPNIVNLDWRSLDTETLDKYLIETHYAFVGELFASLSEEELNEFVAKSNVCKNDVTEAVFELTDETTTIEGEKLTEDSLNFVEYCLASYELHKNDLVISSNDWWYDHEGEFWLLDNTGESCFRIYFPNKKYGTDNVTKWEDKEWNGKNGSINNNTSGNDISVLNQEITAAKNKNLMVIAKISADEGTNHTVTSIGAVKTGYNSFLSIGLKNYKQDGVDKTDISIDKHANATFIGSGDGDVNTQWTFTFSGYDVGKIDDYHNFGTGYLGYDAISGYDYNIAPYGYWKSEDGTNIDETEWFDFIPNQNADGSYVYSGICGCNNCNNKKLYQDNHEFAPMLDVNGDPIINKSSGKPIRQYTLTSKATNANTDPSGKAISYSDTNKKSNMSSSDGLSANEHYYDDSWQRLMHDSIDIWAPDRAQNYVYIDEEYLYHDGKEKDENGVSDTVVQSIRSSGYTTAQFTDFTSYSYWCLNKYWDETNPTSIFEFGYYDLGTLNEYKGERFSNKNEEPTGLDKFIKNHPEIGGPFDKNTKFYDYFVEINYSSYTNSLDAQFDPNISVADVNVSITSFNNLDDKDISNTKANEIVRYYLPKFSSSDFADSNLLDLYKLSKGIDAAGNTVYPGWTYACAQSSSDVTKDNGMFEGGSNSLTNCDVMVGGIVSSYNPPIRDTKGKILTEGTVTVSGGGNSFGLWKRDFYYENEKSQASGYITKSDIAEVHIGGNGYNSTAQNNKLDIQYNMILGESIGTDDDSSVLFEEAKRNYIANNPVPNFIVDSESTDDEILATYNVEWAPETLSVETESGAIITFERTSTIQYSHAPSTSQQLSIWLYENLGYLVNLTNSDYLSKIRETLAQDKESILQITYVYVVSQGSLKTVIINPYEAVWEDEETGIKYTGYNPYTGEVNLNNVKIIQKIAGSELALGIPETDDMTFTAKFCNCKNVETNHECTSYLHFDSDGNIVDEGTEDTVDYLLDTVYWNMADPWKLVPVDESSMLIDESLITHGELLWLDCGKGANLLANIPLKGKGNITYLTTSGGTDQNEAWTTMASNLKVSAGYYFVSLSTGGATAARTQYTNPDTNKTVTKYHYNGASHYSSNSDHFASMGNPKACTSNNGFKDTVVTGDKLNFLYDWKFFTSVKRYYSDNTTALDSKGHILAGGGYGHGYYKIMPLINDWTYTFGTNLDATTDVDMLIPNKGGETPIIVPAASVIDGYVFSHWELKNGPELYRNRDYEEGDVVYVSEIGQDVEFIPVYYPATDTKTITFCYNLPEHSENIQYSHGNDTCPTTDKVLNYDEYTKHIYAAWFGTLFDRFYYDETCSSDPITSAFIQVVTPNAENLSFIGYNTQADGLGVMVTDEFGVITNEDILTRDREDLVLYAQWKKAPVGDYIDIYLNPGQIGSLSNGTAFTRFIRYYRDEGIFYYEDTTSPVQYINEKGTTIKPSGSKTIVPPKSGLGTFLGWFKDDHAPGSVPKDGSKYTDMVLNCASTATNNVVLQGPVKAKQGTVDDKPRDPTTGYFGTLFQEERILEDGTIETVNTLLDREKYPSGSIVHVYAGWNIKSGLQLFLDANRKTNTTSTNGYYYYDSSVYRVTFSNQLFYGEVPKLFTATNEAGDNTPSFDLDLTYPGYKLVGWSFAYKGLGDGTQYDIEGIIEDCVFDADGNYHYITDENVNPYINTEKTIRLWDAQGRYYGTAADVLYAIYVPIEYTVNFDLYNHHGDTTIPEKESIEVFYGNTAAKADAPTNYNNFIAYFDKNCEVEDGVAVKVRKWSASSSEWASWTTITTVDTEFKVAEDWTHPASMTIKDSSNTWGGWILENYRAPKHLGLKYTISDAARRIFSFNNLNTKAVGTKYTFSIENGPAGTCYVASSNDDVASAVLDATGKKVTITANGPGLAVITIVSIVDTESSAYDSQINYFLVYRE